MTPSELVTFFINDGDRGFWKLALDKQFSIGVWFILGSVIVSYNLIFSADHSLDVQGLLLTLWCIWSTVNLVVLVWCQVFSMIYCHFSLVKSNPVVEPGVCPSVSIIKPLHGLKSHSRECLEQIFLLDYPAAFDISFCFMDDGDNLLPLVREYCAKYPHIDTKIYTNCERLGVNPKINNMTRAVNDAQYEAVWMLDANVKVRPTQLWELIRYYRIPGVGCVHQFPGGSVKDSGPGALMEGIASCCVMMWSFCLSDFVQFEANGIGKSLLLPNKVIKELGGIAAFNWCIAEDFFIINSLEKIGLRPKMAFPCTVLFGDTYTARDYYLRALRWVVMRRFSTKFALGEFCIHHSFVLGSWQAAFYLNYGVSLWIMPAYFVVSYFMVEFFMMHVRSDTRMTVSLERLIAFAKTDITAAWCVIESRFIATLSWGGHKYRLLAGGGAEQID